MFDSPPAVVGTFDGLVFAPGDLYLNDGVPTIAETWDGYTPSATRNVTLFSWKYLWENVFTAGRTGSSSHTPDAATGTIDLPLKGTTYTWRLPTQEEWSSFIGTERAGATVNGVAGRHFASVSLTGSSPFVASEGHSMGMLYFPDNITMSLSFTMQDYDSMMSGSANEITTAQLEEAIGKGCVYLPCTGTLFSDSGANNSIGATGMSWSGTSSDAFEAFCYYHDGANLMTNLSRDKSNNYLSVRLVRDAPAGDEGLNVALQQTGFVLSHYKQKTGVTVLYNGTDVTASATVSWFIDESSVATMAVTPNSAGVAGAGITVTPVAAGTATITCRVTYGGQTKVLTAGVIVN